MRSSDNIEQFVIEDNAELYDFNKEYQELIIEKYKTINKSVRGGKLWEAIKEERKKTEVKQTQENEEE